MHKIDRSGMRLREPGQMEIVQVAEDFGFTALQYPPEDEFTRDGDWYFYNKFVIDFCGDLWILQDYNQPHPEPERFGLNYIQLAQGRGADTLRTALEQLK